MKPSLPPVEKRPVGRPKVFRDPSQVRSMATARKRMQRAKLKAGNMHIVNISLSDNRFKQLQWMAALVGSDVASFSTFLVAGAFAPYKKVLLDVAEKVASAWLQAGPTLRYASFLANPGSVFRIGAKVYSYEEVKPILDEFFIAREMLTQRYGWSKKRVDSFFRRIGEAAELRAKRGGQGPLFQEPRLDMPLTPTKFG